MSGKQDATKETPQQAALAELAKNQLADYKQRWLPVQQRMAEQIQSAGARGSNARTEAKGKASTDNAAAFAQAQANATEALASTGAGPGSAKSKLATAGMGSDQATSRGLGMASADQAIDDAYMQGLTAITQLGRGEKASAFSGMQAIADRSGAMAAQDAQLSQQRAAGNAAVAGQAVGAGLALYGAGSTPATTTTAPGAGTGGGVGMNYGFGTGTNLSTQSMPSLNVPQAASNPYQLGGRV